MQYNSANLENLYILVSLFSFDFDLIILKQQAHCNSILLLLQKGKGFVPANAVSTPAKFENVLYDMQEIS